MKAQPSFSVNKKCTRSSVLIQGNPETEENLAKVWPSMWSLDGIVPRKSSLETIFIALESTSGPQVASSLSCLTWWKRTSPTPRTANHFFQVGHATRCLQLHWKPLQRKSSSNSKMTNWARSSTSSAPHQMKILKIFWTTKKLLNMRRVFPKESGRTLRICTQERTTEVFSCWSRCSSLIRERGFPLKKQLKTLISMKSGSQTKRCSKAMRST